MAYRDPSTGHSAFPVQWKHDHAPLPDRRRVARAGPDGDRRGVPLGRRASTTEFINRELKRRQGGYGRGKRQTLETDRIIVDSGIYHGVTTGGPITLRLVNNDAKLERLTGARRAPGRPHRPGRLDQLPDRHPPGPRARQRPRDGACGWRSAALAKLLLRELGIDVFGYVRELGGIAAPPLSFDPAVRDASPVYTLNPRGRPGDRRGDRRGQGGRRHAGRRSSRRSSPAARSGWAATPSGTASSTPGWPWR